jgi:hypothetical protein
VSANTTTTPGVLQDILRDNLGGALSIVGNELRLPPSGGGGSAVRVYTYAQPAGAGPTALIAAVGTYISGFNIGQTMLAAGTISAMSYASLGASAAGTVQVSINGGAFQTIATIVGGAAPTHEILATTAIAVAAGDYIVLRAGSASFSTAVTISFEVI